MALNFEWRVQILDAKYRLAESNCSVTSKLCQLQGRRGGGRRVKWWTGMYCCGKQEINFAIFPLVLKVYQRGAVNSVLDGHDVLTVLATGFKKRLIFQVLVNAVEMERKRLQTALVFFP